MRVFVVVLVIGSALSLVANGVAAESGIVSGQVVTRGSGLACVREPCWQPLAAVPVTFLRNDRVVARVRSGKDGRFRAELLPGRYLMRAPGLAVLSRDPFLVRSCSQPIVLRAAQTLRPTLVIRGAGKSPGRLLEQSPAGE